LKKFYVVERSAPIETVNRAEQNMNVEAWKKSLESMKSSLLLNFRARSLILQEVALDQARKEGKDVQFVGWHENEGRRRIQDIKEIIDDALAQIDESDYKSAARVYHDTLQDVARLARWTKLLEETVKHSGS
jgi:ferritin